MTLPGSETTGVDQVLGALREIDSRLTVLESRARKSKWRRKQWRQSQAAPQALPKKSVVEQARPSGRKGEQINGSN